MATLPEILARLRGALEDNGTGVDRLATTLANEGLDAERDFAKKELLREIKILFLTFGEDDES